MSKPPGKQGPTPPKHTRFGQPGGNPQGNGRPKGATSPNDSLRRITAMPFEEFWAALRDEDKRKCKTASDALAWRKLELAFDGDGKAETCLPALREVWNRIDGKVADRIANADGGEMVLNMVFRELGEDE